MRRAHKASLDRALAINVAALALYAVAATAPFLSLNLYGRTQDTTLATLPEAFTPQGMPELSVLVLATTVLAPLLKLLATLYVLVGLRNDTPHPRLARVARWRTWLTPWSMIEVFLLGAFVAYTRLTALAYVQVGPALYALGLLMLATVAADALLDEDEMWDAISPTPDEPSGPAHLPLVACRSCGLVSHAAEGTACSRCRARLYHRKANPMGRTVALLLTGAVLYLPANIYPVMTIIQLGQGGPHTILGGAIELLQAGSWPLALLVFVASVLVPVLKLVGLGLLVLLARRRSVKRLRSRTRMFQLLEWIGRWSMIDVFMLAVLVALVQSGALATVIPGLGAVCFSAVVVTTMLAASAFDPRLMWDAAEPLSQK